MKKAISPLSAFVKYKREQTKLTQEDLAERAGVGLRFIRDLEQGKDTLRIDKINQVLALFSAEMKAERSSIDPYVIWVTYFTKKIIVTLKNREKLHGILIEEIIEDGKIAAWKFVTNKNIKEYKKTKNENLVTKIMHKDILSIDDQP